MQIKTTKPMTCLPASYVNCTYPPRGGFFASVVCSKVYEWNYLQQLT
ncbi:MAG: hypothetical protein M5U17_08820 [Ignavibacterium sp.]|nr:hypothetical protein [Ignavibacterium sp.]